MFRTCSKLGVVVFAAAIFGCGTENPAPTAEQLTPSAGVNALDQMKQGGTGPKTGTEVSKKQAPDKAK